MKIPVSTKQTQGSRENDFSFVPDGEVLYPSWTCTNGVADDKCGCSRALSGVHTHKGTTPARVIELPRDEYAAYIRIATSDAQGGSMVLRAIMGPPAVIVDRIARGLAKFREGDVVEYREGEFGLRERAS